MAAVSIGSVEIVQHPIETHIGFDLVRWREIPTVTAGGASVARTLQLARDGVFATAFPVTIRVTRAEWFRAIDVAQVRPAAGSSDGVVIDFGIARTVAAVATTDFASDISDAFRWLGANFDDEPLLRTDLGFGGLRPFITEVRTERLQLGLTGASSLNAVLDKIAVQLPE